jgi:hypothetical protein
MFVTGASLQAPPGTAPAGQQIQAARLDGPLAGDSPPWRRVPGGLGRAWCHVTGVRPGHSLLASITAGWSRDSRKITNHGGSAEAGSRFGSRSLPGEPGCR